MEFSPGQLDALAKAQEWLRNPSKQIFRLFGYAGTGKTTLAQHLASGVDSVLYAAYTGKAALVMQNAGCFNATTIHRLIYLPKNKTNHRLLQLEKMLAVADAGSNYEHAAELREKIRQEKLNLKRPAFSINQDSPVKDCDLLIVDEVSMVGKLVAVDLMSFGKPILCLGDPMQLPPVRDAGYFIKGDEPDVLLTEIHRQAEDSPIIQLATIIRNGNNIRVGKYGDSRVLMKNKLKIQDTADFDQVLVGRNATRKKFNFQYRDKILGYGTSILPVKGDRLVCLRNNHDIGLLNGSTWEVLDSDVVDPDRILVTVKDEMSDLVLTTEAHRHHFDSREIPFYEVREADEFDFAYAMTVHKAQGSQWDKVLLLDESSAFQQHQRKWLYTGITRAAKSITVAKQ